MKSLLPIFFLLLISCRTAEQRFPFQSYTSDNERWAFCLNHQMDSLRSCYRNDAVIMTEKREVFDTSDEIQDFFTKKAFQIDSLRIIKRLMGREKRGIEYEISQCHTQSGGTFTNLIIWQKEGKRDLRQFAFWAQRGNHTVDTAALSVRRTEWMNFCNAHRVDSLVTKIYSPSPFYYNHRPLITDPDTLIKEYSYMNNPDYQLRLHPIILEPVNDHIVYEIGQCTGSYGGKYILIWEKDSMCVWKILLDSNI